VDMKRPSHVKPPAYLSKSPPVPKPETGTSGKPAGEENKPDPTRYGDWEKKGIAIDFSPAINLPHHPAGG
jgi:hypothetical protein